MRSKRSRLKETGRGRRKRTLKTKKKKTKNRMRYSAAFPKLRLMEEERGTGWEREREREREGRLVSQTVRKRLTPRIKWYRNETIVEQMPGHKTTASSFPSPIAALSTPVEQAN